MLFNKHNLKKKAESLKKKQPEKKSRKEYGNFMKNENIAGLIGRDSEWL